MDYIWAFFPSIPSLFARNPQQQILIRTKRQDEKIAETIIISLSREDNREDEDSNKDEGVIEQKGVIG